jgi:DNA-binding SARP family transcriptional activator
MNLMPKLKLFLFGNPQVFLNDIELTGFNTRKDRGLLAYLAVTGTAHSREELAGLLWSDLPETKARRNLRHTLSNLGKVIGAEWIETGGMVKLTSELPWSVDVQTLQSAVGKLDPHQTTDAHSYNVASIDTLDQVLKLYRGEFLQGFYVPKAASSQG